jgi:Tol biopolymer transport system component
MRTFFLSMLLLGMTAISAQAQNRIAATRVFAYPGEVGLFLANSDGSEERPLLAGSSESDYDPAWAPDGSTIVFTSDRAGSAELFRVKSDGTGIEQLTSNSAYDDQAAFSPDSKQLVFVSTRNGGFASLWTMDLSTKRAKVLTRGNGGDFRPSWSPDGKWIAFSSSRNHDAPFAHGRWERLQIADIYIVHPDGSGLKKLSNDGFCGSPKWTPDSRRVVAYCMDPEQLANRWVPAVGGTDTKLVAIDVDNGAATELHAGPGTKINPAPLAAEEVGYVRRDSAEPGGIYYLSGKRGPKGNIRTASWSPDGGRVVFQRVIDTSRDGLRATFTLNSKYSLSLTGSPLPAFDRSGERFVGTSGPPISGAGVMLTSVVTGESKMLYQEKDRSVLAPQWSPKGDQIVFGIGSFGGFFHDFNDQFLKPADRVEGGAQVAIISSDGSGYRELTSGTSNSAFPSFSPDGKRLVYREFDKDSYGLRILNLETKATIKLTHQYDNFPLWSPRGNLIMFARLIDRAYEIFTIKPDGSGLKRLTYTHGNDAHMAWSPDGDSIAFSSSRMGFKDEAAYTDAPQPYGEIFVMRYDGAHVEQLTDNQWEEGTPSWQPVAKTSTRK